MTTHVEDTAIYCSQSIGVCDHVRRQDRSSALCTRTEAWQEAAARQEKGEQGAIIHRLFVAAFLVPKGRSLMEMFDELSPYLYPDVSDSNIAYTCRKKDLDALADSYGRMSLNLGSRHSNLRPLRASHPQSIQWLGRAA